jgi:tetratricopeptide (TPR) repeat protein
MPSNKKSRPGKSAAKPAVKRITTQESVAFRARDGKRSNRKSVTSESGATAVPQPNHPPNQLVAFEAAMKLFNARKFHQARERFRAAINGPNGAIGHSAELHVRMCDRRLSVPVITLKTPEEHYNYAITRINARELEPARQHLWKALEREPNADHVYYALALCCVLSGDIHGAHENLKRAIDIQPQNRLTARQDTDFTGVSGQYPLNRLLFPEES